MKIFNKFVESKTAPLNKKDIWFDGDVFRIYKEEEWQPITVDIKTATQLSQSIEDAIKSFQKKLIPGKGISIDEDNVISTTTLFQIVSEIPEIGEENTIYLVPTINTEDKNVFKEYVWINNVWEELGDFNPEIDLSAYLKIEDSPLEKTENGGVVIKDSGNQANAEKSFAEGYNCIAGHQGDWIAPEVGPDNKGAYSHAEGNACVAKGSASHAEGKQNFTGNTAAHAEGENNTVWGIASHIEGRSNSSTGNFNHVEGYHNEAHNDAEHAEGKYNKSNSNTLHSVGIGTSDDDRKNAHEIMQDGKHYVYGIGGYDGTNPSESDDLATAIAKGGGGGMTNVTYSELVELRNNSQLKAGALYRIIDYVTTTVQNSTTSDGRPFDVIVTALTNNTLSEEAKAAVHEGDTYFTNLGWELDKWELLYCLDNDDTRFAWADQTNGKGVIYRMIDDYKNECPYDFKNIKMRSGESTVVGYYSIPIARNNKIQHNRIMPCIENTKYTIGYNVMYLEQGFYNFIGYNCKYNMIKYVASNNIILESSSSNIISQGSFNTIGRSCSLNKLSYSNQNNFIGDNSSTNTIYERSSNNYIGINSSNNYIGYQVRYSKIGNNSNYNRFSRDYGQEVVETIEIGNGCSYNIITTGNTKIDDNISFVNYTDRNGIPLEVTENSFVVKDSTGTLHVVSNGDISKISSLETRIEGIVNSGGGITLTTYADLVNLRNAGQLKAGTFYRITDYVTTTIQENTQSAGHAFDVIVMATDSKTLSEDARAIVNEGDTYFTEAGANLAAWKVWYCLDNDAERFAWADAENGKGVIYRLIDEWGNDCPYDFKSILFKKEVDGEETYILTFADDLAGGSKDNKMMPCFSDDKSLWELPFNTLGEQCCQNFFDGGSKRNTLKGYVYNCRLGKFATDNILQADCSAIELGDYVTKCNFYDESSDIKVGCSSKYITSDDMITGINIGSNCSRIYFEAASSNIDVVSCAININMMGDNYNVRVLSSGDYAQKEIVDADNMFVGLDSDGNLVKKNIFD